VSGRLRHEWFSDRVHLGDILNAVMGLLIAYSKYWKESIRLLPYIRTLFKVIDPNLMQPNLI
jgi:hypothetical protein